MPTHTAVGSDAATLAELVAKVEASGEKIIAVLAAGNAWTVVTEKARPRKPQTRA